MIKVNSLRSLYRLTGLVAVQRIVLLTKNDDGLVGNFLALFYTEQYIN